MPTELPNLSSHERVGAMNVNLLLQGKDIPVLLTALSNIKPEEPADSPPCVQASSISTSILEATAEISGDDLAKRKLVDAGTIQQILAVLFRHPKSVPIIEACLDLLAALLENRPDLHAQIAELKGPHLIIRSMINTQASKSIQLCGCALLLDLTATQRNRELMGEFFAVEVVLSALKEFGEDVSLVSTACAFIANVAFGSTANKDLIVQSGGLKAILRVMKRHKEEETANIWCALALRNLSLDSTVNQKSLTENGCVRVLLASILQHKDVSKLADHSLAVLLNLLDGERTHYNEAAKQTLELRGVEIIVRCIRTFRNGASLQNSAVGCLRALADNGDMYSEMVLSGGGMEAALSSMIAYRSVEGLQSNGIRLINLLGGLGSAARARIVQAGGLNTISLSLRTHIGNEKMVESGVRTLTMLRSSRSS
jgi:Spinocerebellar ataxia type 10 protein domain